MRYAEKFKTSSTLKNENETLNIKSENSNWVLFNSVILKNA